MVAASVLSQNQFELFQDASKRTSSLWTPALPSVIGGTSAAKRNRREAEQFFVDDSRAADWWNPTDLSFLLGNTSTASPAASGGRREAEVFFFDGSKEVHCDREFGGSDLTDDTSSQTASSSEDATSFELADFLTPARLCAWEDIGDTGRESRAVAEEENASLVLKVVPAIEIAEGTLEVFEGDVVEVRTATVC